mgnify:CR=1 FL=1
MLYKNLAFQEKTIEGRCEVSVNVSYENSAGDINTAKLKFLSFGESDGSDCLWLTDESNVNFSCLYCDPDSYSPMQDLYGDILIYLENYSASDGYVNIKSIDFTYEKSNFIKKIMTTKFGGNYMDSITDEYWEGEFKYLVDTSNNRFADIYVSEENTGDIFLIARLDKSISRFSKYCSDNIDNVINYFRDKALKKYI